jgi:hypothetical protein
MIIFLVRLLSTLCHVRLVRAHCRQHVTTSILTQLMKYYDTAYPDQDREAAKPNGSLHKISTPS